MRNDPKFEEFAHFLYEICENPVSLVEIADTMKLPRRSDAYRFLRRLQNERRTSYCYNRNQKRYLIAYIFWGGKCCCPAECAKVGEDENHEK